jgi:hypothetical protein
MKTAFVLMPFEKPFNEYYSQIYKPALERKGYHVVRADDLFAPRPIINDIYKLILEADVILCEMTGRNANVFYELGVAHAVGKPVLLLSQSTEDIPFDLKHIRVLTYNTTSPTWADALSRKIGDAIREVEKDKEPWPVPLLMPGEPNHIKPHKDLTILKGRVPTVEILGQIVDRARETDLIFGSCNTCSDYPREFYEALPKAVDRDSQILFIARESYDTERFIEMILNLKKAAPNNVRLFVSVVPYIRMFGIENKEVVIALPFEDSYFGIHAMDRRIAQYFKLSFDEVLKSAKEMTGFP